MVSDSGEMASILNKYFGSVFSKEETENIPEMDDLQYQTAITDIIISIADIEKKISDLRSSPSTGPDGISTTLLKHCKDCLSLPLSIIYRKSLDTGEVPQAWRDANVTPIFKKGKKSDACNYRPISLTAIPVKILESLIKDKIVNHLKAYNLMNSSQHGFIKNRSCTTNLIEFFDEVTKTVDEGVPMDVIYLDFSKAFDLVPKFRLINKLSAHGIQGKILIWIESWLTNRRQRVVLNGKTSEWTDVNSGVPQGSILGPTAFSIYNNDVDIIAVLISILNKFADDTKIGNKITSEQDHINLQNCLDDLCRWADKWGMRFNETKCKVVHFGKKNPGKNYSMNGVNLAVSDMERDLGVNMHVSLKPSMHCKEAARKANGVLGNLGRSFHFRDRHTFIRLYKTYVRCHLEFAVPAWSPWSAHDIDILEKVQIRAVNMVSGLQGKTYQEKLAELNLESLVERRTKLDNIQTFKMLKGFDAMDKHKLFSHVDANRNYETRLNSFHLNLKTNKSKTEIRRNFYTNRAVDQWNQLPNYVKDSNNVNQFKRAYKSM